jgi:glycosyltransferase involved in cell wall biosynthesis
MQTPRISVGLPVYNGELYLEKAVQSILDQSYRDFELVISDNASTDSTEDICRRFAVRDSRVRYFRNERNIGAAPNHNRVFELSSGEFFKWAAHDDLYPKEMLERCLEVLEKAPTSVCLVYSQFVMIDESGCSLGIYSDPVEKRDPRPHLRLARALKNLGRYSATYGLIRSKALRCTRLEGSFPYSDRVLMAELAMLGEFWEIPEPLLSLRFHPGRSTVVNTTAEAFRQWFDPTEAKKVSLLPLQVRADLELVKSTFQISLPAGDRMLCFLVALIMPCWLRLLKWTFPLRRRIGLAPSVRSMKNDCLNASKQS